MPRNSLALTTLTGLLLLAGAGAAAAQSSPTGVWIDHTGRGAVEITDCSGSLCGHIVWVKDSKHANTCRNQVLGNVKPVGGNTWDRGWIIDPDDDSKYSVELKPMGPDRLRVVGYMGSKLFSETMTWKRAPADLPRCDGKAPEATPASAPAAPAPTIAPPPASAKPGAGVALPPGELGSPASPASAPPQRDAATPPATAAPVPDKSAAAPVVVESLPEPDKPAPRGKRRSASRECKAELPYITLTYPCDAF